MNLLDYSFKNNIEFGVFSEKKLVSINANPFFESTFNTCLNILEESGYTIFVKRPVYRKKLFVLKDYVGSETELNLISDLVSFGTVQKHRLSEFRNEKYVNIALKEERKAIGDFVQKKENIGKREEKGYCIRCRNNISLDLSKPLCWKCYQTWSQFEDLFYTENYCISCGEANKTSFSKPACYNCFRERK